MINNNKNLKVRVDEGITNLAQMGVIPADEAQLNLDVIHSSIMDEICTVVNLESPSQVISYYDINYDAPKKAIINHMDGNNRIAQSDVFKSASMTGVGSIPFDADGYPTDEVHCSIILDADNQFLTQFKEIIPGSIKIGTSNNEIITDDGIGNLENGVGTVNYHSGLITFNNTSLNGKVLRYKYDIYNLEANRNVVKFNKRYTQMFSQMYQLDLDYAYNLSEMKSLKLQDNIKNIMPQLLACQIDHNIIKYFFKYASKNIKAEWDSTVNWNGSTRTPVSLLYDDLGALIDKVAADYAYNHGIIPNILICNPYAFGILSANRKFIAVPDQYNTIPRVVGYYNNFKVILDNTVNTEADIALLYKGVAEAQSVGVFAPYVPVTFRSVEGMESGGMITSVNCYSIAGFAVTNPELIEGIKIK